MAATRASVSVAADAVSAAAAGSRRAIDYEHLLCKSVSSLAKRLRPRTRVAGLDISPTHLSIAISDRERREAAPFGILCRSGDAAHDARSLARAIRHADRLEPGGSLGLAALVVGSARGAQVESEYVEKLIRHGEDDEEVIPPFANLDGVLFYSEAEALRRAIIGMEDFKRGVQLLPPRLETRKFGPAHTAMNPRPDPEDLKDGIAVRAQIGASEVLQAALDDIAECEQSAEQQS